MKIISIRLPEKDLKKIETLAKEQERSISQMIRILLKKILGKEI